MLAADSVSVGQGAADAGGVAAALLPPLARSGGEPGGPGVAPRRNVPLKE